MEALLAAILDDARPKVQELLKADRGLATRLVGKARLFDSKIFHWIYVGDTPLHLAAAGYRVGIAKHLLAAGADANAATNHRRSTPLHYAADGYLTGLDYDAKRQVKMIQCLLAAGADIHAADRNGATPLHRAVRTRCAATVSCLLKAGADPTRKNKPGSTPFHLAVQNTGRGGSGAEVAVAAQREIVNEFLAHGADVNLKNGKGKTVRECARSDWIREMLG